MKAVVGLGWERGGFNKKRREGGKNKKRKIKNPKGK